MVERSRRNSFMVCSDGIVLVALCPRQHITKRFVDQLLPASGRMNSVFTEELCKVLLPGREGISQINPCRSGFLGNVLNDGRILCLPSIDGIYITQPVQNIFF